MRRILLAIVTCIVVQGVVTSAVLGCPVCDTGTGDQVRAGILDENFGRTLLAVLLPFPILLGVVAVIHVGGSGRQERRWRKDEG